MKNKKTNSIVGFRKKTLVTILLYLSVCSYAQENFKKDSKLNSKSKSIEKGYETNEREIDIAVKYEDLARELSNQKNFVKAEEYQNKSIEIYTKLNAKNQLAEAQRKLAKIQEVQNKTTDAISNYGKASKNASNELNTTLNNSDVSRLQNIGNLSEQSNSVNQKISSIKNQSSNNSVDKEEIVNSYKQLAEIDLKQNNTIDAIKNYNNALQNASDKEEEIVIKNEIADIYVNNNQINEAIDIKSDLLQQAKTSNNLVRLIGIQQSLGKLFILNKEEDKGLELIKNAYNLSIKEGRTIEAKNSLLQLIAYYHNKKNDSKKIELYNDFLSKLENLIKSDSSLIDKKLFEETDNRIKLLEKEKTLKDELIAKKNSFNYFLMGALIVLIILILIIIRYSFTVRNNNKKISLQSLRREMNPHFIFNSLNSVNQFIAQNDEIKANKYLTSYSSLMRTMMENSSKDFISLQKEVEQLTKYLELEHLRFNDKFDYKIEIDDQLDSNAVQIPNMIIQPHLENAIWHGLRYKEAKGFLLLAFKQKDNRIEITIDDDGIGVEKSKSLKTQHQKSHQSIGITNVTERIALLSDLYKIDIRCNIINKPNHLGTTVIISVPNKINS